MLTLFFDLEVESSLIKKFKNTLVSLENKYNLVLKRTRPQLRVFQIMNPKFDISSLSHYNRVKGLEEHSGYALQYLQETICSTSTLICHKLSLFEEEDVQTKEMHELLVEWNTLSKTFSYGSYRILDSYEWRFTPDYPYNSEVDIYGRLYNPYVKGFVGKLQYNETMDYLNATLLISELGKFYSMIHSSKYSVSIPEVEDKVAYDLEKQIKDTTNAGVVIVGFVCDEKLAIAVKFSSHTDLNKQIVLHIVLGYRYRDMNLKQTEKCLRDLKKSCYMLIGRTLNFQSISFNGFSSS